LQIESDYSEQERSAVNTSDPISQSLTTLSTTEAAMQEAVRRYALEKLAPRVLAMDEAQKIEQNVIRELFDQGLMAVEVPEDLGGSGGTFFEAILAVEEISRVDPAVGVMVDVQNTLTINALLRWGSSEQKQRLLPKIAAGTICSYALSEASSGSDAFALSTIATAEGDDFVLQGRKLWISNAAEAGLFIVFASVDRSLGYKGITAFLVERDTPRFSVGKKENKLGIRASSTCELILDSCRVTRANVLGEVGRGYRIAIETLNEGRIGIAAQMLGLAQGALDHALRYSKERVQFGKPIAEFQAVQFDLANMATEIEAARLLVYNAARRKMTGHPFVKEAAMAKLFASNVAERVASTAVEIFGGYGFVKEYPVEKLYRDAKIGKIYEGTSNMQLATIAKQILAP
jgi:alkylation response protein AidB-like acyl-CoA dehydrogenase